MHDSPRSHNISGLTHCKRGHAYTHDNTYLDKRGYKICRTCQRLHQKNRKLRFGEQIKKYQAEWQRKKKHGIDANRFKDMYAQQSGNCMICQSPMQVSDACIDHSHETGEIRDLLCRKCNLGLGYFNDSPALLLAANAYLNKHQHVR